MGSLLTDIRYTLRTLRKSPAFTLASLFALALGIGANSAIFTLVNGLLLAPLPYPDSGRIVQAVRTVRATRLAPVSIPKFTFWKNHNSVLDHAAAFDFLGSSQGLGGQGESEQVKVIRASADYFPLFGAKAVLGRTFAAEEDRPGGGRVAVISHGLWKRRFGGDPSLVGRSITLGGEPYAVVGILGPEFRPYPKADLWTPLRADPNCTDQGNLLFMAGRLKPGVPLQTAAARMRVVAEEFRAAFPGVMSPKESATVAPLQEEMVGMLKPALVILAGAVAFVLLIACTNVANLLLARAAGRTREMALRAALGAGRARLVRQLLTESLVLALGGGALGLILGVWGVRGLLAATPIELPRSGELGLVPDSTVLLFTLAVSLVTGILFGLAPAWQVSRTRLAECLKEAGGRSTAGRRLGRTRAVLVVSELALAVVLLAGATLMIRSFLLLRGVQPGFETRHVLAMRLSFAGGRYDRTDAIAGYARRAALRLEALPGVQAASVTTSLPLQLGPDLIFRVEGRPRGGANEGDGQFRAIGPHYLDALSIPLLRGRCFRDSDTRKASLVVIINETLARQFWPGYAKGQANPIGERMTLGQGIGSGYVEGPREIVGIVGDIRESALGRRPEPMIYVPIGQVPDTFSATVNRVLPAGLVIRTAGDPRSMVEAVRRELLAVDGQLPVFDVRPMQAVVGESMGLQRFQLVLLGFFAGVALLLAAVGIYGVMSYAVEQRTHEIGIRMALGAGAGEVVRLVMWQTLRLAGVGLALGLVGALALTRVLEQTLYGVHSTDAVSYLAVALVLGAVTLAAGYIPASRASRVDPLVALRWE